MPLRKTPAEQVLTNSVPEPNSGCWLWCGSLDWDGYGRSKVKHKYMAAHRVSYLAFKGDPDCSLVLHKCDTPSCVNPDHLFLGDAKTNAQDRVNKGRSFRRTFWPRKVLNEEMVLEIRSSTESSYALAKKFGVNLQAVVRAKNHETWREIK